MAESDSVDVIYIATPNNMHYENVKMCLLAGKHVLCEKPFTTSAAQAQELYALAEEKGLFLMEGFWIRFLPVLQKMQELIKEGRRNPLYPFRIWICCKRGQKSAQV